MQSQIFNENKWKSITKDVNYKESFRERKPREKKKKQQKNNRGKNRNRMAENITPGQLKWFKNLMFGLIIAILTTGLFLIVRYSIKKQSEKVRVIKELNLENFEEDIENADLKKLLQEALSANYFKLALRIQYLITIYTMGKLKWIIWKKNKTNGTYLNEMFGRDGFEEFEKITLAFERYWYGEKAINNDNYKHLSNQFDQFNCYLQKHHEE